MASRTVGKLPPEINRIIYVRNLPFKITSEELYDLFGKYGSVYQIRLGNAADTRGTAYVVYDDIYDAKNACESLNGFNLMGRYLIVLYYNMAKANRVNLQQKEAEIQQLRQRYQISE